MPYTVNGIGTTYFGTSNRQTQDGVCGSCNRRGKLINYETWHCICVFFVPLIPLGKKQILDYCPSCTQHRVLPFHEWVKIRDRAIDETATQLSASPDNPDAAIEMHATLAAFQKQDEATQFATLIEGKFPDVAKVQFYLAAWYERTGKTAVANRLFLRAYELDPNDINIRRAALLTYVEEGNLDQAKSMIQPFVPGTDHFDAGIFYALATGFQKQGRHPEAVQTLRMLLDAAPGLKSDKTFRKALAISEKATGVEELTIPRDPFYRTSAFLWLSGTTAIVAAIGLWNSYIASNRSVTVVNGLKAPITVMVDGKNTVQVAGGGRADVTLAEGTHAAEVTVPPNQFPKVVFDMSTGWWERFFRSPIFVVDPTRSAAVLWEEATYVAAAPGAAGPEPRRELRLGETFTSHKHVDYRFAEFPDSIKLDNKNSEVVKTRLVVRQDDVTDLVRLGFGLGKTPVSLLPFLEVHLQQAPERDDLVGIYMALSKQAARIPQCRDFLSKRLTDRPVRVGWHRYYQTISGDGLPPAEARKLHEQLKLDYDKMIEASPQDASLLYLRGRLEGHGTQSATYFERALAIDPQHPYALYATSRNHMLQGEFASALDFLTKAVAAKPNEPTFEHSLALTQFAAGEQKDLEKSARDDLAKSPFDQSALETLLKTLVATNRSAEADQEFAQFRNRIQQVAPGRAHSLLESLKLTLASIKGDFAQLERDAANSVDPGARALVFAAKLETKQLADLPAELRSAETGYWYLCRELVAKKLGDAGQVTNSRNQALAMLDEASDNDWAAADILRKAKTATWEEIADLSCDPSHKAVVLVMLAHERADLRPQLLDLADKLNFDLEFPHYLLQREIAELRQGKDAAASRPGRLRRPAPKAVESPRSR